MSPIRFRCIRCQHAVQADETHVGRKMYCPVCYYQLTVPTESTVKKIDPTQLYAADEKPVDVRDMQDRLKQVSLRCNVCHTNIAVTKEQVGLEIECPECGTKIVVPKEIEEKVEAALEDKLDRIMQGLGDMSGKEVYGVRDGQDAPEEDWSKRFPVYCKLCGTMMYASEDQVGRELTCPDCETKTVVPPRPKRPPVESKDSLQFEGASTFGVAAGSSSLPEVLPGEGMLVPVVCKLCATRMYARESEIGGFKTCPDCETQNEIKAVPKELMSTFEDVSGDYEVDNEQHPGERPVFRTLADYRTVEGSLDKEIWDKKQKARSESDDYSTDNIFGVSVPIERPVVNLLAGEVVEPQNRDEKESEETRKRKQKTIHEKIEETEQKFKTVFVDRPKLPEHPFWTRLFLPFIDFRLIARLLIICVLIFFGANIAVALPGLYVIVSMPIGLMLFVLAAGLLANTCHSLFLSTVSGNDRPEKDDWQDIYVGGSIAFAFWLIVLVVLAALPGLFLSFVIAPPNAVSASAEHESVITMFDDAARSPVARILNTLFFSALLVGNHLNAGTALLALSNFSLIAGSFCLLFPLFFVSSMQTDSFFHIMTKETLASLLTDTILWLKFLAGSFLIVFVFQLLVFLVTLITGVPEGFGPSFLLYFSIIAFGFCALLYFRLLGRLAWVLQEHARETTSEQQDESDYEYKNIF